MEAIVIAHAKKDLGLEENPRGSNKHPRIQQSLRNCGLNGAYPWCCSIAVTWVHECYPSIPIRMTADCDALLAHGRSAKIIYSTPKSGDIFLRLASRFDANHAGLVTSDDFDTIEGNTNPGGSREGYGVFERQRPITDSYVFYRWVELLPDAEPQQLPNLVRLMKIRLPDGKFFAKAEKHNDLVIVPVRAFYAILNNISLEATYDVIEFDNKTKNIVVKGIQMNSTRILGDTGWCGVRELCESLGYEVEFNNTLNQVFVS
jgi:hypothetical protein